MFPILLLAQCSTNLLIKLFPPQIEAVDKLRVGSILCGGVGSGKSPTSLAYYFLKECGGKVDSRGNYYDMKTPKDLYIITTAKKRDTLEWEQECSKFALSTDRTNSISNVKVTIDSWNNIKRYICIRNAFFIFDEQRVVGYGAWTKSFIKIAKSNNWILLSATPGDTWSDYMPVFIANGFYKNKTDFEARHVVYKYNQKFKSIDHYLDCGRLIRLKKQLLVDINTVRNVIKHVETIPVKYDRELYKEVQKRRWNIYTDSPIANISELCFTLRRITNSDISRIEAIKNILKKHDRLIVFYNFNYELDLLRELGKDVKITTAEWNGHCHQKIPNTDKWLYLVQYSSGCEGWNCIETNAIAFYSQSYSYKTVTQAAGRIDRLNTPFTDLYYYHLRSNSSIDVAIKKALMKKRTFNNKDFEE